MATLRRARWIIYLTFAVIVLPGELMAIRGLTDKRSPSKRAHDWTMMHAASLPASMDEIGAYPVEYRRAIFNAMEPEMQARLWREQLQTFLERTKDLNEGQRQYVRHAISILSADLYKPEVQDRTVGKKLCEEGAPLFADSPYRKVFSELGAMAEPRMANRLRFNVFQAFIGHLETVTTAYAAGRPDTCDCSVGSWCSCGACHDNGCIQPDGGGYCGCLWLSYCDGRCNTY
jgi:hypothetical protein